MRDDFSVDVKRALAARVNHVCSNPECRAPTSGPEDDPTKAINVGVAAHITAASPGGARYAAYLTPEQRSNANNGLWLCQNCGKMVDDDPSQFPEEVLRAWKVLAEHRASAAVGKTFIPAVETEAQSKRRKILNWKGKTITLSLMSSGRAIQTIGPIMGSSWVQVFDCTEDFVTVGSVGSDTSKRSIALSNIDISYDHAHDWLELQERYR